jgi:hypothetical protein
MKPGRELDALIAEKVLGIPVRASEDAEGCYLPVTTHPDGGYYHGHRGQIEKPILHYSTQIADAWLVVEKMKANNYCFTLYDGYDPEWAALFSPRDAKLNLAEADTAPLAICLAALKAVSDDV